MKDFEKWAAMNYGLKKRKNGSYRYIRTIAAYDGFKEATRQMQEGLDAKDRELGALRDLAIWLSGCGYDFTCHQYFLDNRHLLTGDIRALGGWTDA